MDSNLVSKQVISRKLPLPAKSGNTTETPARNQNLSGPITMYDNGAILKMWAKCVTL
jgi:hypothetical protein